jgi:hypothetical protein
MRDGNRDLLRLVRHVLGSPQGARLVRQPADMVAVIRPDGVSRLVPEAVLATAKARGLLGAASLAQGEVVMALPTAAAFVRRSLCGDDAAFATQHRVLGEASVETAAGRQTVTVNLAESPLSTVARLKDRAGGRFLPEEAIEAGERLHRDFIRAQLQPRTTMSLSPRLSTRTKGGAGATDVADSALAARCRVGDALDAIGPELAGVAIDVCGFEKGLETVERERQWPARSAKLMLRTALMALARHYAPPPARGRRTHAWGDAGSSIGPKTGIDFRKA